MAKVAQQIVLDSGIHYNQLLEIEHEAWFSEFLGEGPSGHFMRRGETSPFVSKFLK